jgi:glutaredoxin 3
MATPKITIYTTPFCPYCIRAKRLLTQKGVAFEEIDVSGDWAARDALMEKAGGRTTVPQIWIGDTHVGGSDELHALDRAGNLEPLLAG